MLWRVVVVNLHQLKGLVCTTVVITNQDQQDGEERMVQTV